MRFADLKPETIEKLKERQYDCILEKHEGPEQWKWFLESELEFFKAGENDYILLPVEPEHYPNIRILHSFESKDGNLLTVFLKDTTFYDDDLMSGFLAVCRKFEDEEFFTAIVYHEWFILDNVTD